MSACDLNLCFGTQCGAPPPVDSPGTFSYYAQEAFTYQNAFCLDSHDSFCTFAVNADFAQPLGGYGWTLHNGITDGYINGVWTSAETTANQVIGDTSNLIYMSSHGGVSGSSALICLRNCNGNAVGGTIAVGTADIPNAWRGPAWFVLDACSVVQPNVGWEQIFGGNLHGMLGFNVEFSGLDESARKTFASLIGTYTRAIDAWEKTVAVDNDTPFLAMLIPSANTGDVIEARGGPHFGYDGDANPVYYHCCDSQGQITTSSIARITTGSTTVYSLTPESMDENYWFNYYGGANVSYTLQHPSTNENIYRSADIIVDHYLASGGVIIGSASTGTSKGISMQDAYSFATSWLTNNGGLPSDAALTFDGAETLSPYPAPGQYTPYTNVRQYVFTWRHANSGVSSGDKIQVNVDDDGSFEIQCTENDPPAKNHCWHTDVWQPSPHITTYVRVWRSLGQNVGQISRISYTPPSGMQASGTNLCASDIMSTTSTATPCDTFTGSTGPANAYVDPTSGMLQAASEKL